MSCINSPGLLGMTPACMEHGEADHDVLMKSRSVVGSSSTTGELAVAMKEAGFAIAGWLTESWKQIVSIDGMSIDGMLAYAVDSIRMPCPSCSTGSMHAGAAKRGDVHGAVVGPICTSESSSHMGSAIRDVCGNGSHRCSQSGSASNALHGPSWTSSDRAESDQC
jgi:hypothetical protein